MDSLLDCAAFWLHVAGVNSDVALQITRQLLRELFDGSVGSLYLDNTITEPGALSTSSPSATPQLPSIALQLINTSPAFCATFMTSVTYLYPSSPSPRCVLHLLSAWLDTNLYLAFVPLEKVIPTALTFLPGLITWTTLVGLTYKTLTDNTANVGLIDFLPEHPIDLANDLDGNLINRLHLVLVKVILKAPPGTLQVYA